MSEATKLIATNRKARFNYRIVDTYEAGMVLLGSEVKSLRDGKVDFRDSYAAFKGNELFLFALHIAEYAFANQFNHEPTRERKLLLKRRELDRIKIKLQEQGFSLVPTKLYFKNGKVKVEIGTGKGKRAYDKRQSIKEKEMKREADQAKGRR